MLVKEHLKIDVEIQRLKKKIAETDNYISNFEKKISIPGYEQKVPEEIKKNNKEKLEEYHVEKKKLEESIKFLQEI